MYFNTTIVVLGHEAMIPHQVKMANLLKAPFPSRTPATPQETNQN